MISRFVDTNFPHQSIDTEGHFSGGSRFVFIDGDDTRTPSVVVFCWTHGHPFASAGCLCDVSVINVNDAIDSDPIFSGVTWRSSPRNMDRRAKFIPKRKRRDRFWTGGFGGN
jgi:hypothetical protein